MERALRIAAVALLVILPCAAFVFGGKQTERASSGPRVERSVLIGLSMGSIPSRRERYLVHTFEWFATEHGWKYLVEDADGGPAVQFAQARHMISRGVAGLIVSAEDSDAAVPIVGAAWRHNIPVFTAGADVESPDVKMYIGFSNEQAGRELGRAIVGNLKRHHHGRATGTVLEMLGPLNVAAAQERSAGFHQIVDRYPKIRVVVAGGDFEEEAGRIAALQVLRSNRHVDAVFGANGLMACGAVKAMKQLSIDPKSEYITAIGAFPCVIAGIDSGDIAEALAQPVGSYLPIAEHYLVAYLAHGLSALPTVGETITAGELRLSGGERHAGALPWGDSPAWAPARITTELGHLWFQTSALRLTRRNASASSLWANSRRRS